MDASNNPVQRKVYPSNSKKENFTILYRNTEGHTLKLCLFASYNFTDNVADYVFYYLSEIRKAGYTIAFITTSRLKETCIEKLKDNCSLVVERENKGLDFASWQSGLRIFEWAKDYKEVLIANDSVFGPFQSLSPIIQQMNKQYDVWGMTDNYDVDYHLQSYFLHFNEKVISSEAWQNFWQGMNTTNLPKDEIIKKYEVGLSGYFKNAGFKLGVYTSIDTLIKSAGGNDKEISPPLVYWQPLIEKFGFPFLKRELLINAGINKAYWHRNIYISTSRWRKIIEQEKTYPVALIDDFLNDYYNQVQNKNPRIRIKKKKIIFIIQNTEAGDAQRLLLQFIKWLKKNRDIPFEVIAAATSEKPALYEEAMSLSNVIPFWSLNDYEKLELKDRLSSESVGLVFSSELANVELQQFLSFLNVPQVVYLNGLPGGLTRNPKIEINRQWIKNNVVHYIVGSNVLKEKLQEYFELHDNQISIVQGFVEPLKKFESEKSLNSLIHQLGLPANAFVVGISGLQEHRTAADLLPVIVAMLCRQKKDIHIVWLGAEMHDPYFEMVDNDFKKAGIQEQIHYITKHDQMASYYSLMDVFLMPSKEEGFPLINFEVALQGVPIVCFESLKATIDFDRLKIGKAVPYLDITAMRDAVLEYYNNKEGLEAMAPQITASIKENFLTDVQAPELYKIITAYFDENELVTAEHPAVTIMTHIFYDNTWKDLKYKLNFFKDLNTQFLFSVSEACLIKDELVEDIRESFPSAYILTTSNIGKDIGGKFALIDLYLTLELESDYIVFLHDKQSPHSLIGESWKNNLQKVVDSKNYKEILNVFNRDERVGVVGAKEHLICEYDFTNGTFLNNNDRIHIFLKKYGIAIDNYDFFGGTMYWMRAFIIENFFTEFNPMQIRSELEAGNVLDNHGSTNAHTWERVLSWVATKQGYKLYGI